MANLPADQDANASSRGQNVAINRNPSAQPEQNAKNKRKPEDTPNETFGNEPAIEEPLEPGQPSKAEFGNEADLQPRGGGRELNVD